VHIRSTAELLINVEALCSYAQAKHPGSLKPSTVRTALKALGATESERCRMLAGGRPRYWPLSRARLAADEYLDERIAARSTATAKLAAGADQVPTASALREQLSAMRRAGGRASSAPTVTH
jgi:hypothetical protein